MRDFQFQNDLTGAKCLSSSHQKKGMRIAVAQINVTVGDLEGNAQRIIKFIKKAENEADLVVFPELAVTGYPPQDLLFEKQFIRENKEMLSKIAESSEIPCIVGFVDSHNGKLYNAAALINNRRIQGVQHKILLPNYDVFDERRYFTPGKSQSLFEICGKKVGIEICEDLWEHQYDAKPTSNLHTMGAEIIINISASPYAAGKTQERYKIAQPHSDRLFVYCNLVGGQDELVFDGQSFVLQRKKLIQMGKAFKEDFFIIDTEKKYPEVTITASRTEELFDALVLGLRDYCRKTHFDRVVIALSGGIDSSLVACLAVEALGKENVVGIFMPSQYTSRKSREGVDRLVDALGVSLVNLSIDRVFGAYKTALRDLFKGLEEDTTEENIQARIRGNLLMAFSNKFGHLVLASGNKTELALGYCTLYGDMSGGLSVIGDVNKVQVYQLARYYNELKGKTIIPEIVLERAPSAELKEGQVDPFDYAVVAPLVDLIVEERKSRKEFISTGYDPHLIDDILGRIQKNEYKRRQAAPVIKVTKKAFGIGRRYPIANQFR